MSPQFPARQAAEDLYHQGIDCMAGGSEAAAIGKFREALACDPTFLDAMHGLIRALQESGDYDQAIAVALDLVALDPDDILAHTRLSILYQHQGMVTEAEGEALQAKLLGWKLELRESRSLTSNE